MDSPLTPEHLRAVLNYDAATGIFRWRINLRGCGGAVRIGKIAGSLDPKGKRQIKIDGITYFAHRLAFVWMLGRWPIGETDHKSRKPDDNRWKNLRDATGSQNSINRVARRRVQKLPRGVYKTEWGTIYSAIQIDGKLRYLGKFATPEEAHAAFNEAAAKRANAEFLPTS